MSSFEFEQQQQVPAWNTTHSNNEEEDDGNESDYSLDYEYPGPRYANCRSTTDDNDVPSDLSDIEAEEDLPRFDMWDDDPYNDFTWESNDMQLTKFMKKRQKELKSQQQDASFWKKEKGWPKQLPYSCSSTNHDQSANAICLVQSNYGSSEQLYAVYRDRIILCGKPPIIQRNLNKPTKNELKEEQRRNTTLLNRSSSSSSSPTKHSSSNSDNSSNNKFMDTHQSVSLSKLLYTPEPNNTTTTYSSNNEYITQFKPYTKYIKRSDYPGLLLEDAYLPLGFDPQCLAQKYGYMAIGGVEGEFELYCCMNKDNHPVKIWGTKFKGNDNVMLMTNAIQIVRWKNRVSGKYDHMLIGCMNEAGLLFYHLPKHEDCKEFRCQQQIVKLHSHLRSFNNVPINDAKLSPDGTKLVCVGDANVIFMIDVVYHHHHHCSGSGGDVHFSAPNEVVIPTDVFGPKKDPYSSQYVAWSPSSQYFAHTSDSHNLVLIWRASTMEILYQVDAAGYTYAILFHPQLDNILVFTNRYGYFHTVNLSNAKVNGTEEQQDILTFDHQTASSRGHQCVATCTREEKHHPVFHTRHFQAQHEITMVSFRGEINTRLRILAKINGMEWSKDGRYLYLATKKRVLAFRFLMTHDVPSLLDITGLQIRTFFERQEEQEQQEEEEGSRKRKKCSSSSSNNSNNEKMALSPLLRNWRFIPHTLQTRILGNHTQQLACHW